MKLKQELIDKVIKDISLQCLIYRITHIKIIERTEYGKYYYNEHRIEIPRIIDNSDANLAYHEIGHAKNAFVGEEDASNAGTLKCEWNAEVFALEAMKRIGVPITKDVLINASYNLSKYAKEEYKTSKLPTNIIRFIQDFYYKKETPIQKWFYTDKSFRDMSATSEENENKVVEYNKIMKYFK